MAWCKNDLLMQFQADILNVPVIRPVVAETTALGAAYAAGLAVGFWAEIEDLRANWGKDNEWTPSMDGARRDREYAQLEEGGHPHVRLGRRGGCRWLIHLNPRPITSSSETEATSPKGQEQEHDPEKGSFATGQEKDPEGSQEQEGR